MATTKLEIITPREMYFNGEIESLTVTTVNGSEGFLPGHVWCRKLLSGDGKAMFRESGTGKEHTLLLTGGYVEIRDNFTVFTEEVEEA